MERLLKPDKFGTLHTDTNSDKKWRYWKRCFQNFLSKIAATNIVENATEDQVQAARTLKLELLINYVEPEVYEYISEETTYDSALALLDGLYLKPVNVIYARYTLLNRKQDAGQTVDSFLQVLRGLAKPCQFTLPNTSQLYEEEYIRDAFIAGLSSQDIRQKLLEENLLTLNEAYKKARALESAHQHNQSFNDHSGMNVSAIKNYTSSTDRDSDSQSESSTSVSSRRSSPTLNALDRKRKTCGNCGKSWHTNRAECPAQNVECFKCNKVGHFMNVCRSSKHSRHQNTSTTGRKPASAAVLSHAPSLASVLAGTPESLSPTVVRVCLNNKFNVSCLVDTGSSDSFINNTIVKRYGLDVKPSKDKPVTLAAGENEVQIRGVCATSFEISGYQYRNVDLKVLDSLCADMILGIDLMKKHNAVQFHMGGKGDDLIIDGFSPLCGLTTVNREPQRLFEYLDEGCKPIRSPSRKYSSDDNRFIANEVQRMLQEGIIVPSSSPWRAQLHIDKDEKTGKKRLCVDYSQTINKYTQQNAYPLPTMHDQVTQISEYKYYSHLDLTSAYHQLPLHESERIYTAFEAQGNLYEFTRVPFGVTNGPPIFQREIDNCIRENELEATFAYIDNITIAGMTKEEHDKNLKQFFEVAAKNNFVFNEEKSVICKESIDILGYRISQNSLKPDPARLKPLQDLPAPEDTKCLKRIIGLFAYYSSWISNYSEKIRPLLDSKVFPLSKDALTAFEDLKAELGKVTLQRIDENMPFTVETDASDFAIAAILNQGGRPVAFFSRSMKRNELSHPAVEKEACAVVEALRKWSHFLHGKHFTLFTDQEAVSYIFNRKNKKLTKIKNDKMIRWRIELSCFDFDIVHKPGVSNVAADAMSRVASIHKQDLEKLRSLHSKLAHPGVTRLLHYVRSKNMAFSAEDVRSVVNKCPSCCKIKPRFYQDQSDKHLIKATAAFERLNVDYKGPLPDSEISENKYILNIVDEYSRFPFAFACSDMKWTTVKSCFLQLFAIFGTPNYVHSDRGSSFLCQDLKDFLHSHQIATSNSSPYNPRGNGQVERYNGVLWKAISVQLEERGLSENHWEKFLPDALHSIRSLLCTATNCTPHERFFSFNRKTCNGTTLPTWLTTPGPILLKRHARKSKYEPLVEEAELIDANSNYGRVKLQNGIEKNVSLRDLAPIGEYNPPTLVAKIPNLSIKRMPIKPGDNVALKGGVSDDNGFCESKEQLNVECKSDSDVSELKIENEIPNVGGDSIANNEDVYVTRYGRVSRPVERY